MRLRGKVVYVKPRKSGYVGNKYFILFLTQSPFYNTEKQ